MSQEDAIGGPLHTTPLSSCGKVRAGEAADIEVGFRNGTGQCRCSGRASMCSAEAGGTHGAVVEECFLLVKASLILEFRIEVQDIAV